MNSPLSLSIKNSFRNKRRSLLTVLSIAMSLFILGFLMAIYHAFYISNGADDQALRLIVRHKVSLVNNLPSSYQQKIQIVPGVKNVMAEQWFGGVYKDNDYNNQFPRFACEPEKLFNMGSKMTTSEEEKKAWIGDRTGAMVGRPLMTKFGWKLGDRVTIMGDIFPVDLTFTIRGVYDAPRDAENFFFHYKYLDESTSVARGTAGIYVVLVDDPKSVPRVSKTIDDEFKNSPAPTRTETERAFELSFLNYLGNVKLFLLSLCAAVTFMLMLVSGNTVAMVVRERVKEIGILKTLGFTPSSVLFILIAESVMIALLGAAIGLVGAHLMCAKIASGNMTFADLKLLYLPQGVVWIGLALAILIALVGTLIPAWPAVRRSIVDCLRVVD